MEKIKTKKISYVAGQKCHKLDEFFNEKGKEKKKKEEDE